MCLPKDAILASSEISHAAFKLYACYCAHRSGETLDCNVSNEQISDETGIGYAYASTLKGELLEAGWIDHSLHSKKGIVPLKGFVTKADKSPLDHVKVSTIERTSDNELSINERNDGVGITDSVEVLNIESPEKVSINDSLLSDEVSTIESFKGESSGTPVALYKAETTNTEKELKPKTRARKRATLEDFNLPDWLSPEVVERWLGYRAELGHPVMLASAVALVRELEGLRARGHPPELVIERSIANGWRGLFELPERNGKHAADQRNSSPSQQPRKPTITDAAREHAEYFGLRSKAQDTGKNPVR